MISVSIDVIKQDLLYYLKQIDFGEKVLILQADKAIAELKPVSDSKKLRPYLGLNRRSIGFAGFSLRPLHSANR